MNGFTILNNGLSLPESPNTRQKSDKRRRNRDGVGILTNDTVIISSWQFGDLDQYMPKEEREVGCERLPKAPTTSHEASRGAQRNKAVLVRNLLRRVGGRPGRT